MNADNKDSLVFKNTVNILHVDFSSNSLVSFNKKRYLDSPAVLME